MKRYKYILFDLDGTLTDPEEGITKSIAHGLEKMGMENIDLKSLRKFIGPPLRDSFMKYYNFDEEETKKAIELQREYFRAKGKFENIVYEGIEELLKTLKGKDYILAVATSKPEVFAVEILEHFGLKDYFTFIGGSLLDGNRTKKADVIKYVMESLEIVGEKSKIIMIGDREHDIIGAKANGIDSIGVRYGFAEGEELQEAGATYILNRVEDLKRFFDNFS